MKYIVRCAFREWIKWLGERAKNNAQKYDDIICDCDRGMFYVYIHNKQNDDALGKFYDDDDEKG